MLCRKPFTNKMTTYGCGQCMPCRCNRRRVWSHRMMLEALVHERTAFVTLTYKDEKLPEGGSLDPRHLQLFLKKLRKNVGPVRFFGVGEYGDLSWRPHYHLAIYGVDRTYQTIIHNSWGNGIVHVGDLTHDSAQYIAGYVNKKMTDGKDDRLEGRYPEFARMSLRPGIGAVAIADVAGYILKSPHAQRDIADRSDVPHVLQHARKTLPLGRYMRDRLRKSLNLPDGASPDAIYKKTAEMLAVYKDYVDDTAVSSITGQPKYWLGKQRKEEADTQKAGQMINKMKMYNQQKL